MRTFLLGTKNVKICFQELFPLIVLYQSAAIIVINYSFLTELKTGKNRSTADFICDFYVWKMWKMWKRKLFYRHFNIIYNKLIIFSAH